MCLRPKAIKSKKKKTLTLTAPIYRKVSPEIVFVCGARALHALLAREMATSKMNWHLVL